MPLWCCTHRRVGLRAGTAPCGAGPGCTGSTAPLRRHVLGAHARGRDSPRSRRRPRSARRRRTRRRPVTRRGSRGSTQIEWMPGKSYAAAEPLLALRVVPERPDQLPGSRRRRRSGTARRAACRTRAAGLRPRRRRPAPRSSPRRHSIGLPLASRSSTSLGLGRIRRRGALLPGLAAVVERCSFTPKWPWSSAA